MIERRNVKKKIIQRISRLRDQLKMVAVIVLDACRLLIVDSELRICECVYQGNVPIYQSLA